MLTDHVQVVDDALSPALCAALLDMAVAHRRPRFNEPWRRCDDASVPADWPRLGELVDVLHGGLERYRQHVRSDALGRVQAIEWPNVFRYDADDPRGPNRFHRHVDAWSMGTASRVVSAIFYLNDVTEGGETRFPKLELDVAPRAGRAIFFPSSFLFEHEGLAPRSGPKFVLVAWYHFAGDGHRVRMVRP